MEQPDDPVAFAHRSVLEGPIVRRPDGVAFPLTYRCVCCRDLFRLGFEVKGVRLCHGCAGIFHEVFGYYAGGGFMLWANSQGGSTEGRRSAPPTQSQRMRVYRRDDFTCRYCGEGGGDLTVDHVDPEGDNEMDNLATACRSCNSRKHRRTPEEAGMELIPASRDGDR